MHNHFHVKIDKSIRMYCNASHPPYVLRLLPAKHVSMLVLIV